MQHQSAAYWADVRHGDYAHDFFGCTYYPWSALKPFPILQKAVLINPLVYASEGMRATLAPQFEHLSITAVIIALLFFDTLLLLVGLRQFEKKAVT